MRLFLLLVLVVCSEGLPQITLKSLITPITTQTPDWEYYGLYSPNSLYGWYCHWFNVNGEIRAFAAVATPREKRQERWWPQLGYGTVSATATNATYRNHALFPTIGFNNQNGDTISYFFDYFGLFPYDKDAGIVYDIWLAQHNSTFYLAAFDVHTEKFSSTQINFDTYLLYPAYNFFYKGNIYYSGFNRDKEAMGITQVNSDGGLDYWYDHQKVQTDSTPFFVCADFDPTSSTLYYVARFEGQGITLTQFNLETKEIIKRIPVPAPSGSSVQGVYYYKGHLFLWLLGTNPLLGIWDLSSGDFQTMDIPVSRPGCNSQLPVSFIWKSQQELWISSMSNCPPNFPAPSGHDEKIFVLQVNISD